MVDRRNGGVLWLSCPVPCLLTDVLPTAVTVFCVAGLIAGTTVGAALTHDIALPS